MFAACMNMCMAGFRQRLRALTWTAALALAGVTTLLVAAGFGLSLLYVWLQQIYGTMPALAIVAGGCAAVALLLFMLAFLRPASRRRYDRAEIPQASSTSQQRTVDEAIAAVQQGSRESMLAALAVAVIAGMSLGRKL